MSTYIYDSPLSLDAIPESVILRVTALEDLVMCQDTRTTTDIPQKSHLPVDYLQSDKVILPQKVNNIFHISHTKFKKIIF